MENNQVLLFENCFAMTTKLYQETFSKAYKKPIRIIMYFFSGLSLLLSICFLYPFNLATSSDMYLAFVSFIFCLSFFFLIPCSIRLKSRQHMKYEKIQSDSDSYERSYRFYEDFVVINGVPKFNYTKISKVVLSPSLIVIILEKELVFSVKKDSFTVGNYNDFISFLQRKQLLKP